MDIAGSTYLEPQIVKWWMPDAVIFDSVPLTATGKIDKKTLRDRYRGISSHTSGRSMCRKWDVGQSGLMG